MSQNHSAYTIAYEAKRLTHNATGLGNYGRMLVEMLSQLEPQNKYLLYTPTLGRDELRQRLPKTQNVELRLPSKPKRGAAQSLWRTYGITKELPKNIDLFHGLAAELPMGLQRHGIKSVVTIHDLIFLHYPAYYQWIDRKIYTYKYRKACQQANRIIAVSQATKRDIVRYFNIPPEKIEVIYQGCDASFKQNVDTDTKLKVREKYGLPKQFILSVGSIEERKNLLLAVRALKHLDQPITLVAIGKRSPYTEKIESYIKAENLNDRIRIINNVSFNELPAFYQMATMFVYPSRYEGFGIPLVEAACSALPIIGATGSCLEEAGGPHAIYVEPDNVQQMAEAMNKILNNKELANEMGRKSREYAKKFEPEILVNQYMEVYRKIIENKV